MMSGPDQHLLSGLLPIATKSRKPRAAMRKCCALAGMSATYPLDMVRGRLTVQSMQGNHRYRGIMHATSVIIKEVSSMPACPGT